MPYGDCSERVYENTGNQPLLKLLTLEPPSHALDCGCGAGDNARALSSLGWEVVGITISHCEQSKAARFCKHVYVYDLESGIPPQVTGPFKLILFSHVLEHLRHPDRILQDARKVLAPGGLVAVALPNVLNWRNRFQFFIGQFEYKESGIMDSTHVRFYTFVSGKRLLEANGFQVVTSAADGSAPLRWIRRSVPRLARYLDHLACKLWPGLFGWQLLYLARPKGLD